MKNNIITLVKVLVAAGLIAWLVKSGHLDFNQLMTIFTPTFLLLGYLVTLVNICINNFRWYILLRCQGFAVTYWSTLKLSFIGLFFNLAMPGGVGGDLVKGYYTTQDYPERKLASAASIFIDRLIGFFSMVVVSLVALAANYHLMDGKEDLRTLAIGAFALFLIFGLILALSFSGRSKNAFQSIFARLPGGKILQRLHEVFYEYRSHTGTLFLALILSVISQSIAVIFFILVGEAMGAAIPWQAYFFIVPVGLIAMAAPIAPAGIGVGQAAFLALFTMYLGYQSTIGPTAITANQIVMLSWGVFGSIFYFRRKRPDFDKLAS
ncbi:MAG: lysylphosphatidylglycerol synthase transmembrane domain-containing protein [Bdellovibrionales bacterium]